MIYKGTYSPWCHIFIMRCIFILIGEKRALRTHELRWAQCGPVVSDSPLNSGTTAVRQPDPSLKELRVRSYRNESPWSSAFSGVGREGRLVQRGSRGGTDGRGEFGPRSRTSPAPAQLCWARSCHAHPRAAPSPCSNSFSDKGDDKLITRLGHICLSGAVQGTFFLHYRNLSPPREYAVGCQSAARWRLEMTGRQGTHNKETTHSGGGGVEGAAGAGGRTGSSPWQVSGRVWRAFRSNRWGFGDRDAQ